MSGCGRVLVPVNFRLSAAEIEYILEHSGASMLLVDEELAESVADLAGEAPGRAGRRHRRRGVPRGPRTREPWDDQDEDATATINYTSGTTARPKGVELTHRNLWTNSAIFGWHTGVNDRDAYLHTLPMFHCNGWGMPYALTAMGVPQVVLRKVDGADILRRIDEHGVTLLCGAPAVVAMVLEAAAVLGRPDPGRGTRAHRRGRRAAAHPHHRAHRDELGWEFIQIYGLTETAPLLTINRTRAEWDDLAAGEPGPAPRPGRRARGRASTLPVDGEGEVLARGNHILQELLGQPEESAEALDGGWFHTGDGGTIDDGGYLTISDRKKDVIITGGENVSSIEVEDALFSHPAVAEVCVIGVPRREVGRDDQGARRAGARAPAPRRTSCGRGARSAWPATSARPRWSSATSWPARPPASSRSSSSGPPTGRAGTARSTDPPVPSSDHGADATTSPRRRSTG